MSSRMIPAATTMPGESYSMGSHELDQPDPSAHTGSVQIIMNKRLIAGLAITAVSLTVPVSAQTAAGEVVLRAAAAPVKAGAWTVASDAAASGSAALLLPDAGAAKIASAAATPRDYFDSSFQVRAGVPYRLWFRARAQADSWSNDSAFVQFSGSVTSTGSPVYRIGTADATVVSLEQCSGCGVSGWGWSDNGYGGDGPVIYFAADGPQTVRVQGREDGLLVDEIVLSP